MGTQQQLTAFLRALLSAKKSFALYPAGSEMATTWVRRLGTTLADLFREEEPLAVRVGPDRFLGLGVELRTTDPALEVFRSELEVRGIADFSIDSGVEEWELQAFLELLTRPPAEAATLAAPPAFLRERNVIHVSVGVPGGGGLSGRSGHGGSQGGAQGGAGAGLSALHVGKDLVDLFVDAVLETVDERLGDLAYDRAALLAWFQALAAGDRIDVLYRGITTLGAMVQGRGDREVCTRTVLEALLLLPERTLQPLLSERLLPLAGSDLVAFTLLTQVTEDELAEIARLVPAERLMALITDLVEVPWEQGKRQRVVEGITSMLRRRAEPRAAAGPLPLIARDDPVLVELRQEIVAACQPDVLLERSAEILLALIFDPDQEEIPSPAIEALQELVAEALTAGQAPLVVRLLRRLEAGLVRGEAPARDTALRDTLRHQLAGRAHVALAAGLLRQDAGAEQIESVATYLQLVAASAVDEFLDVLGEESDRRLRLRMCQVLVQLGPPVLPQLVRRFDDPRWFVARNALYVVGKIGHPAALGPVVDTLAHRHPGVRVEAVRSAGLIGGAKAVSFLLGLLADPDPRVCRTVIWWLGTLKHEVAVGALRDLLVAPATRAEDWELKQEAAQALVAIGTPTALAALEAVAGRRASFWQRADRRLSEVAAAALTGRRVPPAADAESPDAD